MCNRAELWLLGAPRSHPDPWLRRMGHAEHWGAQCCSHTAARGEKNTLLETGIVRLRGFGECMFYSFLNVMKCPCFIWFFLQLGCTEPGSPAGVSLARLSVVCRDMSGTSTPGGLSSASCSISCLLNQQQVSSGYFLSPLIAEISML